MASTVLELNQKNGGMFIILIISQIVNFKVDGDVLKLRKCYQCGGGGGGGGGGETLVSEVKHLVSDSICNLNISSPQLARILLQGYL